MRKIGIVLLILIIAASFGGLWWKNGTSEANPKDKKIYTFVVGKEEGVREISSRLKKQDLIKDPIVFF